MIVADKRAGQESGFAQDLKSVAATEHKAAVVCEAFNGPHYWRVCSNRTASQMVAVGESTGEQNRIEIFDRGLAMPNIFGFIAKHICDGVAHVAFGP